jgi:flagellar protein FlbD
MIQLTRLNNHPLALNPDLVKFVEQAPDTVITLINGEKIVVRESSEDVQQKILEFRQAVLRGLFSVSRTTTTSSCPFLLDPEPQQRD